MYVPFIFVQNQDLIKLIKNIYEVPDVAKVEAKNPKT